MNILLKNILIGSFLMLLLSISTSYAQSENNQISNLIEKKRSFNKQNKNSTVYKIQLYNGNETQAYKIRSDFQSEFPEFKTAIMYKSPEWKTQVGNFETRLEADRILLIIKEKFAGAIVLEDKI
tara:strand:- start:774 stop:1145 length:372 start_codon:yes stop_codon:yes gene_type:complete